MYTRARTHRHTHTQPWQHQKPSAVTLVAALPAFSSKHWALCWIWCTLYVQYMCECTRACVSFHVKTVSHINYLAHQSVGKVALSAALNVSITSISTVAFCMFFTGTPTTATQLYMARPEVSGRLHITLRKSLELGRRDSLPLQPQAAWDQLCQALMLGNNTWFTSGVLVHPKGVGMDWDPINLQAIKFIQTKPQFLYKPGLAHGATVTLKQERALIKMLPQSWRHTIV